MEQPREKFATQMDAAILAELRLQAKTEGRELDVLITEAVAHYLATKRDSTPRAHVMETYQATLEEYDEVYKKLAE
tara:strand:+ start:2891 stop:3118 length:228 start_codon:yes stop_codon:yes gene_type:complete